MTRKVSLHHLSAMEFSPVELVHVAADAGFDHVFVFVHEPVGIELAVPLIGPDNMADVRRAMRDRGITAYNLEAFWLGPDTHFDTFRPALERGATLGGTRATAIISDTDHARAAETFAAFAAFAALTQEVDIEAGLEFMIFSAVRSLREAAIIEKAGKGTIALDVLHLIRTGGMPDDAAALDPASIGYLQLCDGPRDAPSDLWAEAVENRLPPGNGFPAQRFPESGARWSRAFGRSAHARSARIRRSSRSTRGETDRGHAPADQCRDRNARFVMARTEGSRSLPQGR